MPSSDAGRSLGDEIVHRWKEELFSTDTVVAIIAVVVALPAALLAARAVASVAVYPVLLATATGPSLGYWRGLRIEVDRRTGLWVGAAMALAIAAVTTGLVGAALALDAGADVAVGAGAVGGILFGGLVSRVAFVRLAGEPR